MEKSESIKSLATALGLFQIKVGPIGKSSTNPFFNSKYASLPVILQAIQIPLQECGLVISQIPEGNHDLTTILVHSETGEYLQATYNMTPVKDDPQGIGSCITYQRRYALGAILGLCIDEDDDGNNASQAKPKQKEKQVPATAEIKDAIEKLSKCDSIDDLKLLKETLSKEVIFSTDFSNAATKRFTEITTPKAIENKEDPPTTEGENKLPWLTEALLMKAKERMEAGDLTVWNKTVEAFRMKKQYRSELDAVHTRLSKHLSK